MQMLKRILNLNNPATQMGLIGGGLLIVALVVALIYWVFYTKDGVLFSGLDPRDAATIVEELKNMDVSYKLDNGGSTIYVPEDMVHNVRLQLMSSEAKLISGVGFELFDKSDFGMTEFVQKINFQRALQGELTRTITSLKEIKYARVHLVLPEHSLFNQDGDKSRASVTLFMKDGETVNNQQVQGIQRLVASAVPNMDVNAVTVVDQSGVTLSRGSANHSEGIGSDERLQRRQEMESYLTKKVNQVLEKAFGPNQALASIDVTLNLDQIKTTVEDYLPNSNGEKGMVRKRETKNQPATDNKNNSVTTEVEYKLGRKVEQIVNTPGSIKTISVGVLVPENATEQRIYQIEELVAATVGLNKARGDEIVVHAINMANAGGNRQPVRSWQNNQYSSQSDIGGDSEEKIFHSLGLSEDGLGDSVENVAMSDKRIVQGAPSPVVQNIRDIYQDFKQRAQSGDVTVLGILGLILLIFAFTLFWMFTSHKRQAENTLSVEERERLLRQLNSWLESDDNAMEQSKAV